MYLLNDVYMICAIVRAFVSSKCAELASSLGSSIRCGKPSHESTKLLWHVLITLQACDQLLPGNRINLGHPLNYWLFWQWGSNKRRCFQEAKYQSDEQFWQRKALHNWKRILVRSSTSVERDTDSAGVSWLVVDREPFETALSYRVSMRWRWSSE